MAYTLGIDLGGTAVKALAVEREGGVLAEWTIPTEDQPSGGWKCGIAELLRVARGQLGEPLGVGVAAPGLPSSDGDSICYLPGRLQGLEGLNWRQFLGMKTHVPVLNDARAALAGEAWLGAARGCRNAILLTLGTGVGGAALVDGRILGGHLGRAGHLGHLSLDPEGPLDIANTPGSLEDAIGECTILQRSGGRWRRTSEMLEAAEAGDEHALSVWLKSMRALAAGCASLVNLFDPEILVIGGGISKAGALLLDPLERDFRRFEWCPGGARVRMCLSHLGNRSGALGAAQAGWAMHFGN